MPRIELIQFDRNRLDVFAAGSNLLPNSPGFEPHALREGARLRSRSDQLPERLSRRRQLALILSETLSGR